MIDWKISIGAILCVLLTVLLAHLLNKRRESENILRKEILNFKETFITHLQELDNVNANPGFLVTQYFQNQDKAARKLLLYLPSGKARLFRKYWNLYTQFYNSRKELGFVNIIATEVDDIKRANVGTNEGLLYIHEQTERRRKEAINLIQQMLKAL